MKYKMKAIIGQNHFELWQGDEKIRIISNPIMAFHVEDTLNMETAAYQEEIATLKAALSASGEKLAEVRGFVRDVAKERFIGAMCEEYQHVARKLVASWDSADDSAAESTPKYKVGDRVRLNFFGHYEKGEYEVVAKVCDGFYRLEINGEYNGTTEYYDSELEPYNESE